MAADVRPLEVVVACADGPFRRLAAAALSRAGHRVSTVTARSWRLRTLLSQRTPDVIVLEGEDLLGIDGMISGLAAPPALVFVADKWGPLDSLVNQVEAAAAARRRRPPLRVLPGGV